MDAETSLAILRDWLIANGINPSDVPRRSPFIIHMPPKGEAPMLEYSQLARDDAGRFVSTADNDRLVERRMVQLKAMPALTVAE